MSGKRPKGARDTESLTLIFKLSCQEMFADLLAFVRRQLRRRP